MDESILREEQSHLASIQKTIVRSCKKIDLQLNGIEVEIKNKLQYVASEKMDDLDKAEIFSQVHMSEGLADMLKKEQSSLERVMPKPFFARIDYQGEDGAHSFHIGIKSVGEGRNMSVLDWRTPVCSLLYDSNLGHTSYQAQDTRYEVDLRLKRQFKLEPNRVVSYVDTDTKIDDSILQDVLSQNSSQHMTNIVQSIQQEQNALIRCRPQDSLIINGVAGSGKTSIAMHRIAYIMFASRDSITSENILVLSPNKLFSTYISDLLPELGEENVSIKSLPALLADHRLVRKSKNGKAEMIKGCLSDPAREQEVNTKCSFGFLNQLDAYLDQLDVSFWLERYCHDMLDIDWGSLGGLNISPHLNFFIKAEIMLETYLKKRYLTTPISKIDRAVKNCVQALKKYLDVGEILQDVYRHFSLHIYPAAGLGYEDVPVQAYIRFKIFGMAPDYRIKHIFIDEVQDYDAFSLSIVKNLFPAASFTLAGDSNQNILSLQNNLPALQTIFETASVHQLSTSYRSTFEIMQFANQILGSGIDTRMVRHGAEPMVLPVKGKSNLKNLVDSIVSAHPDQRLAVLAKTEKECKELKTILKDFDLVIDEESDAALNSNHIITTIYISKGLEFDSVLVYNVGVEQFSTPKDRKFLYVACTRALHNLYLTYPDHRSPFLSFLNL